MKRSQYRDMEIRKHGNIVMHSPFIFFFPFLFKIARNISRTALNAGEDVAGFLPLRRALYLTEDAFGEGFLDKVLLCRTVLQSKVMSGWRLCGGDNCQIPIYPSGARNRDKTRQSISFARHRAGRCSSLSGTMDYCNASSFGD